MLYNLVVMVQYRHTVGLIHYLCQVYLTKSNF